MPASPDDASQAQAPPREAPWTADEVTGGIAKLTPEERPVLEANLEQIVAGTEALIREAEDRGHAEIVEHLASAVESLKSGAGHVGHLEQRSRRAHIAEHEELRQRAAEAEVVHVRAGARDHALLQPTKRGTVNELRRVALITHFSQGDNDFDPVWWAYALKTMTEAMAQRTGKRYVIDIPDDLDLDGRVIDLWEDEQITFSVCEDNCGGKLALIEFEKSRLDHERLAKFRAVDVSPEARRAVANRAAFIEGKRARIEGINRVRRLRRQRPIGRAVPRFDRRCSRGKAHRRQGSRRVISRSAGGGSSGSDDPDPEPSARTGTHDEVAVLAGGAA
jgi:hypothetical protein